MLEILIQPALEKAQRFTNSLHIRYLVRPQSQRTTAVDTLGGSGGRCGMTSHIILQRKYRHLEALVRSAFEPAEDVKVIIDRRRKKRRASTLPPRAKDRRRLLDRRCATPFMDILIDASG